MHFILAEIIQAPDGIIMRQTTDFRMFGNGHPQNGDIEDGERYGKMAFTGYEMLPITRVYETISDVIRVKACEKKPVVGFVGEGEHEIGVSQSAFMTIGIGNGKELFEREFFCPRKGIIAHFDEFEENGTLHRFKMGLDHSDSVIRDLRRTDDMDIHVVDLF